MANRLYGQAPLGRRGDRSDFASSSLAYHQQAYGQRAVTRIARPAR